MPTWTGLDSAASIPAGSVVESVYYTAPDAVTLGDRHPTEAAAVAAGLARQEEAVAASRTQPGNGGVSYVPERFSVDLRWVVRHPPGSTAASTDLVARRTTYDSFDDARAHLARLRKYAH